jgi:hypothetical protein
MEILIYLDESDKKKIEELVLQCTETSIECDRAKSDFWLGMIEKYPYLKNKRISLNTYDGYIFEWYSARDLAKHANLGQFYV